MTRVAQAAEGLTLITELLRKLLLQLTAASPKVLRVNLHYHELRACLHRPHPVVPNPLVRLAAGRTAVIGFFLWELAAVRS